jgi:quercetin dioxygenase-like cupin family protein
MRKRFVLMTLSLLLMDCASPAQTAGNRTSRTVLSQQLPPMDGSRLTAHVVEVLYAPGGASPVHTHPCPVIGYVAEGAIRIQVKGQPEVVYHAGESFYEAPNGVHQVSANASNTKPAKLLAFFVCDNNMPLSMPVEGERK